MKKVAIGGGAPIPLCAADNPFGASWDADGTIYFGQGTKGVWKVPAVGGAPQAVVAVKEGESAHGPQRLPRSEWLLFTLRATTGSWDDARIVAQSLATEERRSLINGGRDAQYVSSGHLVYGRAGALLAVPFDAGAVRVTGGAVSVIEGISSAGIAVNTGAMHAAIASTGSIIYRPGTTSAGVALVWVDRQGREQTTGAPPRAYASVRLSPDGSRVAVRISDADDDIWVYSLGRGTLDRITLDPGSDEEPVWTPDGTRLTYFSAGRAGGPGVFVRPADGTGNVDRLTSGNHRPHSWSPDGRHLLFADLNGTFSKTSSVDLGIATPGEKKLDALIATPAAEYFAFVSPDGRWLVYAANETGQNEVFVRPFPDVQSGRWRISTEGGSLPLWAPDGRTLFYVRRQAMMAVAVNGGPPSGWGTPEKLFEGPYSLPVPRPFDVSPDGTRFLMLKPAGSSASGPPLVFVEHWIEELKRRVPVK